MLQEILMYAVKTFTRNAPATPLTRFSPQTIARWLGASALAVGALGFANQSRADELVWSVGVASPGVRVVVGNAPPVVYQPVVYPHVYPQVHPQVVHPHVVPPQVVYPHRPLVPFGHARPVVVVPQPIYYNHGPHGRWEPRYRGHSYGQVGAYGGGHGGNRDGSWGGYRGNNGGGDNPRQGPGQGGGRGGHQH